MCTEHAAYGRKKVRLISDMYQGFPALITVTTIACYTPIIMATARHTHALRATSSYTLSRLSFSSIKHTTSKRVEYTTRSQRTNFPRNSGRHAVICQKRSKMKNAAATGIRICGGTAKMLLIIYNAGMIAEYSTRPCAMLSTRRLKAKGILGSYDSLVD